MTLKDEALAAAANLTNVAQFASFAPNDGTVRIVETLGATSSHNPHEVVSSLLQTATSHEVNIRSFLPGVSRGNPFVMGLRTVDEVLYTLSDLARRGYYAIVNESIDVNDGGVSGVRWNGWTEFAPKDTPRCVERPGVAGLPAEVADRLFQSIYGCITPLAELADGYRVEFSLHPTPVGLKKQRTLVWELSEDASEQVLPSQTIEWPNNFSEMIGDKAYGLLVADALGFRVPKALCIGRDVAPFEFGRETQHLQTWTRTCPARFSPGVFPTEPKYVDIFAMLAQWDPDGSAIASVLVQQGVRPRFSGAVVQHAEGKAIVSGVSGAGAEYMQGDVPDEPIPRGITTQALRLYDDLTAALGGPCRFEWVRDDRRMWLVQVNRDFSDGFDISTGDADLWVDFDPADGTEALRSLIDEVSGKRTGINLKARVGLTSHIGDLLRLARVPARVPASNQQPKLW